MIELPSRQLALARFFLGLNLVYQFVAIMPFGGVIFSDQGWCRMECSRIEWFPGFTQVVTSETGLLVALGLLALLSLAFCLGFYVRAMPLLIWYGLVSLAAKDNFFWDFDFGYMGWLLFAFMLVPKTRFFGRRGEKVQVSKIIFWGAWLVLGVSYTVSGLSKLKMTEWQQGTTVGFLAHISVFRFPALAALVSSNRLFVKASTWFVLAAETLFLPLIFTRWTRLIAWVAMILTHAGIILLTHLTELNIGCLIFHVFVFDPAWFKLRRGAAKDLTSSE